MDHQIDGVPARCAKAKSRQGEGCHECDEKDRILRRKSKRRSEYMLLFNEHELLKAELRMLKGAK